jgi:hypothetical protein
MAKLSSRRGDSITYRLKFTDGSNAVDITGYTIYFTVKNKTDNETDDTLAVITKDVTSHTDALNGITDVILSASDMSIDVGAYKYDFQFKTGAGDISTVSLGEYEIIDDVTKRTT